MVRRLHDGEEVTHRGLVTVEHARIWEVPEPKPELIAPAISVETARRAAHWADGLITVNQAPEQLRKVLAAYRDNGGRGKAALQVHLSWAPRRRPPSKSVWTVASNTFAPHVAGRSGHGRPLRRR